MPAAVVVLHTTPLASRPRGVSGIWPWEGPSPMKLALRIIAVLPQLVLLASKFAVPGADKKKAVLAAIPDAVELVEGLTQRDLVQDPDVAPLLDELVELQHQVRKARDRLKQVLATKGPAA